MTRYRHKNYSNRLPISRQRRNATASPTGHIGCHGDRRGREFSLRQGVQPLRGWLCGGGIGRPHIVASLQCGVIEAVTAPR